MNINSTNLLSYVSNTNLFKQANIAYSQNSQETQADDFAISKEGQMMGRMLRHEGDRQAHQAAFTEAYESLGIESLDTENMTDEEITEVLTEFETMMGEHMQAYKPASEMDSEELQSTLNHIKEIGLHMTDETAYGQGMGKPPMGGRPPMGGKPPMGGIQSQNTEATDETSEEDILETMLELLNETEESDSTTSFLYRDMTELLALFNS